MQVGKTLVSFYDGACSIVGMNEFQEKVFAERLIAWVERRISCVSLEENVNSDLVALLARALEIAAPDLSPQRRASLFCDIDAMLQAEREACAIAAINAPIKTATQPIREACANAIRARNEII